MRDRLSLHGSDTSKQTQNIFPGSYELQIPRKRVPALQVISLDRYSCSDIDKCARSYVAAAKALQGVIFPVSRYFSC